MNTKHFDFFKKTKTKFEEFSDENKIKYEIVHERFAKFDFN